MWCSRLEKEKGTTCKRNILSSHLLHEEQPEAKTVSLIILALPSSAGKEGKSNNCSYSDFVEKLGANVA